MVYRSKSLSLRLREPSTIMKRLLSILVSVTLLSSCSFRIPNAIKYKDYHRVRDYRKQMELVEENFPEIYNLYRQGDIVIDEVFEHTDRKTGKPQVHVSYYYRNGRR